MSEILRVAVGVSTPLALLGLIAALGYFAYTRRLKYDETKLKTLPPGEVAKHTDEYLTRYNIDGKKLPLSDQLALIKDEMAKKHQKAIIYLVISAVVFTVCFGLAVLAFGMTHKQQIERVPSSTGQSESKKMDEVLEALTASLKASTEKEMQFTTLLKQNGEKDKDVENLKNQLANLQKQINEQIREVETLSKTRALSPEQAKRIAEAKDESKRLAEDFLGFTRKMVKTSISQSPVEVFSDLFDLVATFKSDSQMRASSGITSGTQRRVVAENRNVRVSAYLYAAKKELDNDYHLILGTDPESNILVFLSAEISGLPSAGPFRERLRQPRTQFETFFAAKNISFLEGLNHPYTRLSPPIRVMVTGSLFWNVDHSSGVVGPQGLRPKTNWEIHPVTEIEFR